MALAAADLPVLVVTAAAPSGQAKMTTESVAPTLPAALAEIPSDCRETTEQRMAPAAADSAVPAAERSCPVRTPAEQHTALAVADLAAADFDATLHLAATGPKRIRSPAVLQSIDVALLCISNQFSPQFS
jgi:hypothetical protein